MAALPFRIEHEISTLPIQFVQFSLEILSLGVLDVQVT
jgi:hypothetical protein